VLISGAGPIGLFLACELALAKCSVLILERAENPHSPLKRLPFGLRGLSAPSIEALYRRGLLNELELHKLIKNPHQNSGQGARRQVGHFVTRSLPLGKVKREAPDLRFHGNTRERLAQRVWHHSRSGERISGDADGALGRQELQPG
jgi:2-polyprenyl-6-methoxyphenol hydroxylase-like FAD-dependent oxidoreductase